MDKKESDEIFTKEERKDLNSNPSTRTIFRWVVENRRDIKWLKDNIKKLESRSWKLIFGEISVLVSVIMVFVAVLLK